MKSGWQIKRLGEVCEIIKGRKPKLKESRIDGDLPYLIAKVIRGSKEPQYASINDRNSVTVDKSETIIICDGSNSGEVFTGFSGILSSTMGKISIKPSVDDNYLRAFLASTFEVFNGSKTGAAIPHLDKEAMYQLEFPLPPIPEQQRIVRILDEAFDAIATAMSNAKKNLQNARALFESHLDTVFTQRGEEWVERRLRDVCFFDKNPSISPDVPYVGLEHIEAHTGRYIGSNDLIAVKSSTFQFTTDHVLYGRLRPYLNKVMLPMFVGHCSTEIFPIKPVPGLSREFLQNWLMWGETVEKIVATSTGTRMPRANMTKVLDFSIFLPSEPEQKRIIAKLDELRKDSKSLESNYQHKLTALNELKKSLLHQAFTGAL